MDNLKRSHCVQVGHKRHKQAATATTAEPPAVRAVSFVPLCLCVLMSATLCAHDVVLQLQIATLIHVLSCSAGNVLTVLAFFDW